MSHPEPPAAPVAPGPVPGLIPGPRRPPDLYWPPPTAWPAPLPPPPRQRRGWLWLILSTLLGLSALLAAGGVSAAAFTRPADGGTPAGWVEAMRPTVRDPALVALLERRAKAVLAKDKMAFMADVDPADPAVVKRQGLLFDNLTKMPFADLRYTLAPDHSYTHLLAEGLRHRYHQTVLAVGVTVSYKIAGVDSKSVTAPWVPIFGYTGAKWVLAGETDDKSLPFGAGGQPWDAAGPITVVRSARVVAVLSADDTNRGPFILRLAETGLDQVAAVRSGHWDGKVLITAVQDQRIFDRYFADSPDRVAQVAAIAVPYFDRVPDWESQSEYATTRVVFNPQELSAPPEELGHDLAHEFTHAAMGPVTTNDTPRWLVEGFAEYVAYKPTRLPASVLKKAIGDLVVDHGLPSDGAFYREPRNYVGAWLACRLIAERFGEGKLIALYEAFQRTENADTAIHDNLGVDRPTLEGQWRDYVNQQRK